MPSVGPPLDHIIVTEIDGDLSLYDPRSAEVLVLNSTASDIWRLSDGTHSLEDLVSLLAQSYGVEPSSIEDDIRTTVDDLVGRGFLAQVHTH